MLLRDFVVCDYFGLRDWFYYSPYELLADDDLWDQVDQIFNLRVEFRDSSRFSLDD